jgi:hypothetical protein
MNAGVRDKTVEFEDDEELANAMLALINDVNVACHYFLSSDRPPDHDATGAR